MIIQQKLKNAESYGYNDSARLAVADSLALFATDRALAYFVLSFVSFSRNSW